MSKRIPNEADLLAWWLWWNTKYRHPTPEKYHDLIVEYQARPPVISHRILLEECAKFAEMFDHANLPPLS